MRSVFYLKFLSIAVAITSITACTNQFAMKGIVKLDSDAMPKLEPRYRGKTASVLEVISGNTQESYGGVKFLVKSDLTQCPDQNGENKEHYCELIFKCTESLSKTLKDCDMKGTLISVKEGHKPQDIDVKLITRSDLIVKQKGDDFYPSFAQAVDVGVVEFRPPDVADTVAPVVTIQNKPSNPSNLAVASMVKFSWIGSDKDNADEIRSSELTYQCHLDGMGPIDCGSGASTEVYLSAFGISQLDNKTYIFKVVASDKQNNTGEASYSWLVTPAVPTCTITNAPTGFDFHKNINVNFDCQDLGVGMDDTIAPVCKVGGVVKPCSWATKVIALSNLGEGEVTVTVDAVNKLGVPASQGVAKWTVDFTPPTLSCNALAWRKDLNGKFSFGCSDNLSGCDSSTYECQFHSQTLPGSCDFPTLADSATPYNVTVFASDNARNSANGKVCQFQVDQSKPSVQILSGPGNGATVGGTVNISFSGHDVHSGIAGYECSIDDGASYQSCTSPKAYASLVEGETYVFKVRSINGSGLNSDPDSRTFTYSNAKPTCQVDPQLAEYHNTAPIRINYTCSAPSEETINQCAVLNGDADETAFSDGMFGACSDPTFHNFDPSLFNGPFTIAVRAIGAESNAKSSLALGHFIFDNVAPQVTANCPAAGYVSSSFNLEIATCTDTLTSCDATTKKCYLGTTQVSCEGINVAGAYKITVADLANNTGTSAVCNLQIDQQGPTISFNLPTGDSVPNMNITWTATDAISGLDSTRGYDVRILRNGTSCSAGTVVDDWINQGNSAVQFATSDGVDYLVEVRAYDNAGNMTTACSGPVTARDMVSLTRLVSGVRTQCLIKDSELWCWGENGSTNLALGTTSQAVVVQPSQSSGAIRDGGNTEKKGVIDVALGASHACMILEDEIGNKQSRTIRCWGNNGQRQLGNPSCSTDSGVQCRWPANNGLPGSAESGPSSKQLSTKVTIPDADAIFKSVKDANGVPLMVGVPKQLAVGDAHTCVLMEDDPNDPYSKGQVYCWGYNNNGQLGGCNSDLYKTNMCQNLWSQPVNLDKVIVLQAITGRVLTGVDKIVAGLHFNCALTKSDGNVYCWGKNGSYQLGLPDQTDRGRATLLQTWTKLGVNSGPEGSNDDIAAGGSHVCVIKSGVDVYCWGSNGAKQAGETGSTVKNPTYVYGVSATLGYRKISGAVSAGSSHSCVIDNGKVRCWGSKGVGRLGFDPVWGGTNSVGVVNLGGVMDIGGSGMFNIDSKDLAVVMPPEQTPLGTYGSSAPSSDIDVSIKGAVAISSGEEHSCVLHQRSDGAGYGIKCWGKNTDLQLGNGYAGQGFGSVFYGIEPLNFYKNLIPTNP